MSKWSAAVLSKDLDVIRKSRDAVRASPLVDRTESILVAYDNYEWLKAHEAELPAVAWSEPSPVWSLPR